jgi:hypothetical protein
MAGPSGSRHPGQICTVGQDIELAEAKQLVAGGYADEMAEEATAAAAKPVKGKRAVEAAVPPASTSGDGAAADSDTTAGN